MFLNHCVPAPRTGSGYTRRLSWTNHTGRGSLRPDLRPVPVSSPSSASFSASVNSSSDIPGHPVQARLSLGTQRCRHAGRVAAAARFRLARLSFSLETQVSGARGRAPRVRKPVRGRGMSTRSSSLRLCLAAAAFAGIALAPLVVRADAPTVNTYAAYKIDLKVGEPSIGFDPKANAALYGAGTDTERLTWDTAGTMSQTLVDAPTAQTSLDAITFVDAGTHRTFNSQLPGAASLRSYSDDPGPTCTPPTGCGINTLLDHQSVGGGPYHAPLDAVANPLYPHAVYYRPHNGFTPTSAHLHAAPITSRPRPPIP